MSGGGRDGIASNKRKDGGFDGERAEARDKGELPTQNTDHTPPASLPLHSPYGHHPLLQAAVSQVARVGGIREHTASAPSHVLSPATALEQAAPPPPAGKGWGCLRCQPGLSSILILPELLHVGLSEKAGRCGADASEAESWASDASFPFHCAALSVSSRLLIASRCSSRNTGLRALSSRILTFHLIASNSLR